MAQVTHAAPHLPLAEVKNRMRTDQSAMSRQHWLILSNALVEPGSAEEIARHCGVSKASVHAVISRYNRFGVAAIETPGKGGRRRQYLPLEEEKEFLAPFFAQAEGGEIATVRRIWHAYAQHVGHEVDDRTMYRLLHRHGWRKVMPRPRHPKSDPETQEQFKKTDPSLVEAAVATQEVGDERPVLILAQDEGCFGRISQVSPGCLRWCIRALIIDVDVRAGHRQLHAVLRRDA
jgi:transposase